MNKPVTVSVVSFLVVFLAGSLALASTQARVGGVVVDTSGEPIAGATITITCPEAAAYKKVLETDGKGRFKILLLDATKSYVFSTTADGYMTYNETVKVPAGTMDNDFTFQLTSQQESQAASQAAILEQPGYKEYDAGRALLKADDLDGAHAQFTEAVAAMPDLAPAWGGLADIEFRRGNYDQALEYAETCIEHDDESTKCLAVAVNSANALGDEDAKKQYLELYQAVNPDDPATIFNQAADFLNALDDDSARPLLEQCLELDPEFEKCLFELGMVLLRSGDLEGAKDLLNRYLEVAPEGPEATAARETVKYL
jgi:tetratricopeptide (TPR) repeat protein